VKNFVFWNITPCGFCKNRTFGGIYGRHHRGDMNRRARNDVSSSYQPKQLVFLYTVLRFLVTANVIPSSTALVTLIMGAIRSSETSLLKRATRSNMIEDGILRYSDCLPAGLSRVRNSSPGFDKDFCISVSRPAMGPTNPLI
jgi:hypothetical protein